MRKSILLTLALLSLMVCRATLCLAAPRFADAFEDRQQGEPPNPENWQVLWLDQPGEAAVVENQGSDATHSWCTLHGRDNLGLRSKSFGAQREAWATLGLRIDEPVAGDQMAVVSFVDDLGQFPCDLRFHAGDGNTFDAVLLSRDPLGAVSRQIIARGLTYHQWRRWTFGVKIDEATGWANCWVYCDGRALAENIFVAPFSKTANVNHLQVWGMSRGWSIDSVRVDTTNPDDEAALRIPLHFAAPRTDWRCDYTCQIEPDGEIHVQVGKGDYTIRSGFSLLGGGFGWLGPPTAGRGDRPLAVGFHSVDGTGKNRIYKLSASTEQWRLARSVELHAEHVAVQDTLTNLSQELIGIRLTNEVRSTAAEGGRVGGTTKPEPFRMSCPERPIVQLIGRDTSLGLIARDDVYRNQSVCFAAAGGVGLSDDHFGLEPGASYTLRWEIYPLATTDHFDFVNAIRQVWGTNRATIPGLFAAIYHQRTWIGSGKTLHGMSTDELRRWLDITGIQTLCICLNANPDAPGHETAQPQWTKPWLEIEAFGSDVLHAEVSRAYWRPIVARLREAKPDLQVMPYFHMACNPIDPAFADARVLRQDGSQKIFRNFADVTRGYYYPTPTNGFGGLIRRVFRNLLDDPLFNGMYWDEFSFGNVGEYLYDAPDWDGHSLIIDPQTNRPVRRVTNFALVTRAMREELLAELARRGKPLWTNWQPTTEHDVAMNAPHFLEYVRPDETARGHLGSPLGAGGYEVRNQADVMKEVHDFLQQGLLYLHLHNGAYAETTESVLKHCYPITPQELHRGYILGRERILTARSGTFGFGDSGRLEATIFGRDGIRRAVETTIVEQANGSYCDVRLADGELAIILRRPK
jgi:hypothetical protein